MRGHYTSHSEIITDWSAGFASRSRLSSFPEHSVRHTSASTAIPPGFPDKYRDSLIRSADLCAVKKHLENLPAFEITTTKIEPA
jgi:hypothetical protein